MRCEIRLLLYDPAGRPFMGVGTLWLLQRIDALASVRQAALDMEMSYPKALRMIQQLENQLGQPVVVRTRGGRAHGGAVLTPFGRGFVEGYIQLIHELQDTADARISGFIRPPG
ncbi:MAG: ModE family transcriptional regulator [Deltaproteobacteria bacterium HGW-Deltaproteobacteria-17]|nr:MAG: ModE family transcriptional regulator [Deltaproteobacteria bacterium HGW-Deltaproteobacteria-17]